MVGIIWSSLKFTRDKWTISERSLKTSLTIETNSSEKSTLSYQKRVYETTNNTRPPAQINYISAHLITDVPFKIRASIVISPTWKTVLLNRLESPLVGDNTRVCWRRTWFSDSIFESFSSNLSNAMGLACCNYNHVQMTGLLSRLCFILPTQIYH